MNKKQLYESIMRNVSYEIKKSLNETYNEAQSMDQKTMSARLNAYCQDVLEPLRITVNINDSKDSFVSSSKLIVNCAGYIIEQYVRERFVTMYGLTYNVSPLYNHENGIHHDFTLVSDDGTEYNFEVKALLNGKSGNIKLTQQQTENGQDYIFIFVNYTVDDNTIIIKSFNIVPGADAPVENFLKNIRHAQTLENKNNNIDYNTIMKKCSHFLRKGQKDIDEETMKYALGKYLSMHPEIINELFTNDDIVLSRNNMDLIERTLLKIFHNDEDDIQEWLDQYNSTGMRIFSE